MEPKKKTVNPFNNKGFSYEAWQAGYESQLDVLNPYEVEAGDLHQFWEEGRKARLSDVKDIPVGCYCYHGSRAPGDKLYKPCPYWSIAKDPEKGLIGSCSFLSKTDGASVFDLLWDQVKACDENND